MSAKILKFTSDAELKANLDAFNYDDYLKQMFSTLASSVERAGYNGEEQLTCTFRMDAKEWKRLSTKGLLGGVYARDLSNYLYRNVRQDLSSMPSVNDKARASKGFKTIQVSFLIRR